MHAADQVPGRIQALEEALQIGGGRGKRLCRRFPHRRPQAAQDICGQVLRARHHRRAEHEAGQFGLSGSIDRGNRGFLPAAVQAQGSHVASSKAAPPGEGRRQGDAEFGRPEMQQSRPAAGGERLCQAGGELGLHGGCVVRRLAEEMAVRGQAQAEAGGRESGQHGRNLREAREHGNPPTVTAPRTAGGRARWGGWGRI